MALKSSKPENTSKKLSTSESTSSDTFENTLRPSSLDEYIGQSQLKKNLKVFLQAAQNRNEPLEHTLLYGPPGLGKTTLALIIAKEMAGNLKMTAAPAIDKQGDLAAILTNLKEGDVLFIDEIHRLKSQIEEVLYSAMEDYCLDLIVGKGPSARTMKLQIPKFTLIGATTKYSMLSSPLRDRFGHIYKLNYYSEEEITKVIQRSSGIIGYDIEELACKKIAQCARKTPRIANRLLKRIRDFAEVDGHSNITLATAKKTLNALEIDPLGLDKTDIELLQTLIQKFAGGPVGLNTLSAATGADASTIEEVYEPFLIQLGFLDRSPRGRIATPHAYQHLGIEQAIKPKQNSIF
jgi:holliday junction DNA helicase RuvB